MATKTPSEVVAHNATNVDDVLDLCDVPPGPRNRLENEAASAFHFPGWIDADVSGPCRGCGETVTARRTGPRATLQQMKLECDACGDARERAL